MINSVVIALLICIGAVHATQEPAGPSQQCTDDAGPPWGDDLDGDHGFIGTEGYFAGTPATPEGTGDCPTPLAAACQIKSRKAAFLSGPVDCGGKGWFCRISRQESYSPDGGFADSNFAYCNSTDGPAVADEEDGDGHCHGSDTDDVYGWWVRDHWYRGYAGRLTCCCDWNDGMKGLVNRCDYRKPVAPADLSTCRDANEEHSKGETGYAGTCAAYSSVPFADPAEQPNNQCWMVSSFADPLASGISAEAPPAPAPPKPKPKDGCCLTATGPKRMPARRSDL